MPLEEDEHERDTSLLTLCELKMDDSHNLPPGHHIVMVLVSSTMFHHVYRRRERGLKDQEDYVGVLNILLLPGGDHWHDHMEQEITAAPPASFSLSSTRSHLNAVLCCTYIMGFAQVENVGFHPICLKSVSDL